MRIEKDLDCDAPTQAYKGVPGQLFFIDNANVFWVNLCIPLKLISTTPLITVLHNYA